MTGALTVEGALSLSLSCGLSFALSHAVINIIHRARTQPTSSRSKHSDLERMDVAMQTCFSSLSLSNGTFVTTFLCSNRGCSSCANLPSRPVLGGVEQELE